MKTRDLVDTVYLSWFSKPATERPLYRMIGKCRIRSIVEIGVRDLSRTERLIRAAKRSSPTKAIRYTGIDLFDARPSKEPPLTLKRAHQMLAKLGVSVRLIPGDADTVLAMHANQLAGTQMLLVQFQSDPMELGQAWYYVPRMLTDSSLLLLQSAGEPANPPAVRRVSAEELDGWARAGRRRQRIAA